MTTDAASKLASQGRRGDLLIVWERLPFNWDVVPCAFPSELRQIYGPKALRNSFGIALQETPMLIALFLACSTASTPIAVADLPTPIEASAKAFGRTFRSLLVT